MANSICCYTYFLDSIVIRKTGPLANLSRRNAARKKRKSDDLRESKSEKVKTEDTHILKDTLTDALPAECQERL